MVSKYWKSTLRKCFWKWTCLSIKIL